MKRALPLLLILCNPGFSNADQGAPKVETPAVSSPTKTVVEKKETASWKPGDPMSFRNGEITFDVQERLRYENRLNTFDFNSRGNTLSLTDDSYLLERLRLGLRFKPNAWINSYVQTQDAREIGSSRPNDPGFLGSEGDQYFSLRQANVAIANFKESPFGATVGRQELSYGDERLVGAFDWNNIGRVFDGFRFRFQQPKWNLETFAVMPVSQYTKHFDVPDTDDRFYGLYYHMEYIPRQATELYAFYRNKTNNDSGYPVGGYTLGTDKLGDQAGTQAGDYATLGTRIKSLPGAWGPWDYSLEVAGQFGSLISNTSDSNIVDATTSRKDLLACALNVGSGYTFEGKEKNRLGAEYNYASGDSTPSDGTNNSFQNLFPTNHKFYGYMDLFAWRNMQQAHLQYSVMPIEKLNLQIDYRANWIEDTSDGWFRANGYTQVRPVGTGATLRDIADNFAGQEMDLSATYPVTKWLKLHGGYSHFFAGQYLHDTGAAADADFFYLQTVLQF